MAIASTVLTSTSILIKPASAQSSPAGRVGQVSSDRIETRHTRNARFSDFFVFSSMKSSFPPIVDKDTRILILGSLPGEESLRLKQYYGNPRNDFWPILFRMFNVLIAESYQERLKFLKSHKIGLWDVIHTAERVGSSDSNIRNPTPNDFEGLLRRYPDIKMLAFNGRKAENTFRKLVLGKQKLPDKLVIEYFPSTSPAHKYISVEDKYAQWSILRKYLED